jgi:HSP20 family molecular chaperone IbpA
MADLRNKEEIKYKQLADNYKGEYDQMYERIQQSREHAQEKFENNFKESVTQQKEILDEVNRSASNQVKAIQKNTMDKIAAYSSRQSDPFYRMKRFGADLYEGHNEYVLEARIPEHEQSKVSVSVRGDQLVLSNYRQNQDRRDEGNGHVQTTASYQTVTESFPLYHPVDPRGITKEFEGDTMIVRIPKKARDNRPPLHKSNLQGRVRVEPPKFPANLHVRQEVSETHPPDDDKPPEKSKRGRDSGVLG